MNVFNNIKLFIYENKRKIIIISSVFFLIACFGIFAKFKMKDKFIKDSFVYEDTISLNEQEEVDSKTDEVETSSIEYYYVDIKGYVNNPGVYTIEKGKRVVDAINIAGGLKNGANTSLLNMSMLIKDQMVIIIYSNYQVENFQEVKEKEAKQAAICNQEIKNDACIVNQTNLFNDNLASEKININQASKELLMTLSKIGESKAIAIIEYRTKHGNFKSIEDIKQVNGIGESLFETIKDYITI